jgi:FAD/FMN-containing dehydrogenase
MPAAPARWPWRGARPVPRAGGGAADRRDLDDLNKLKKDNTGYNLRNLFIGAEGTLGVITAAVLKLLPKPAGRATAFLALPSPEEALALLSGGAVVAFEIMPRSGLDMVIAHAGCRDPSASAVRLVRAVRTGRLP